MFVGRPPGNYDRLLGLQPRGYRFAVLRAVRRPARGARRSPGAGHRCRGAGTGVIRAASRRFAENRLAERRAVVTPNINEDLVHRSVYYGPLHTINTSVLTHAIRSSLARERRKLAPYQSFSGNDGLDKVQSCPTSICF
jgi:hypothetical protein